MRAELGERQEGHSAALFRLQGLNEPGRNIVIFHNGTEHLFPTNLLNGGVVLLIALDQVDQRTVISFDLPAIKQKCLVKIKYSQLLYRKVSLKQGLFKSCNRTQACIEQSRTSENQHINAACVFLRFIHLLSFAKFFKELQGVVVA